MKNRRDYSGDERKSDHTKREIDRSSNPRFRTRLDKRLRNIHRKYVKTGEFTGNVWINVELLLQDSLDYANGIDIISEWRFKGMVSKLKERREWSI